MASRGKDKKEIDPEELMRRKFRAKCLFRGLGRLVMENAYWLIESVDHYEGDDVKRRVEQAVRGKTKQKQLLSIKDKALLNKPAEDRTEHEKKYIYRIIGGLKCFKRYPNHVKRKLAAVTYFKYYGPNRVIVRQNQEAHALYFIVSGDVVVTHLMFDELLQQYESVEIGTMHTGDMFGEVSLLHNIPRTATVTTVGHCEFLQLLKEDFRSVLLTSVQKQWDEVRHAMSFFTYFDALDEVASREGCIMAKLKSYKINETLLGDGCGIPNYVYFILTGRVQMIESMQVIVTKRLGRQFYTLYDPYVPKEESEQDFDKKWFSTYPDLNRDMNSLSGVDDSSGMLPQRATLSSTTQAHVKSLASILRISSVPENIYDKEQKEADVLEQRFSRLKEKEEKQHVDSIAFIENLERTKSIRIEEGAVSNDVPRESRVRLSEFPELSGQRTRSSIRHSSSGQASKLLLSPIEEVHESRPSVRYSIAPTPEAVLKHHGKIKTYFMQVCQMNPGSTFGFGENMRDRRIIALTPVNCMLMPKIWLLQRNTANIWTRIQYYLEKKIPNKKKLFEEFVSQRRWEEYKDQNVNDVVARSNTVNYTTVHDVPYSIRMEEMFDI